jgi:hypothetical protein
MLIIQNPQKIRDFRVVVVARVVGLMKKLLKAVPSAHYHRTFISKMHLFMLYLQQKLTPDDRIGIAVTRLNMSEALTNLSNFDEALVQCSTARDIMIEKLGDTHHTVGLTIGNMAKILRAKGLFREALALCTQSHNILENSLGRKHMAVGIALSEMVRCVNAGLL